MGRRTQETTRKTKTARLKMMTLMIMQSVMMLLLMLVDVKLLPRLGKTAKTRGTADETKTMLRTMLITAAAIMLIS